MKRFVVPGIVLVVVVAVGSFFAALVTGLTCYGEGDTYATESQAARYCDSGWSSAFFLAEIAVPVICMIVFVVLSASRERFAFLGIGAAASVVITIGMAAIPPNLNTECSAEQVKRGDNCGY